MTLEPRVPQTDNASNNEPARWNSFRSSTLLPVAFRTGEGSVVDHPQAIAQLAPLLRRYARALTGSQSLGDAYVVAALEAALADKAALRDDVEPRVALYRLFTKMWNSASARGTGHHVVPFDPGERKIVNMTPLSRQAFLLTQLEGFDNAAAARVLDVDAATLNQLIDDSGCELADLISTDVLIIEDEAFIAIELTELVERLGHTVIGVAKTHAGAIALMKNKTPGLILADIRLADGSSGLDAVNELLGRFEVPVIFITAYPDRFLTGQRPEPAFLIAKPFEPGTVSAVVSQALFFEHNARRRELPVPA